MNLPETPCILFTGHIQHDGYGRSGNPAKAPHRTAYEQVNGPIPEGLEIDHLCNVRHCINPDHLEAVTHAENCRRKAARTTHCKNGHPWSEENSRLVARENRGGAITRVCRACALVNKARYLARKKASA